MSGQWLRLATGAALVQSGPLKVANTYSTNQAGATFSTARLMGAADNNTFSGRSMLFPIEIAIRRAGTPTYYSPAGVVSTVRAVSLAKFAPEDELSIASETWVVFPIVNKRAETYGDGDPHASGNVGFAVRKTA